MTIDFYYTIGAPYCRPVLLLAKALDVQLNLKTVTHADMNTPEFLKINPQHCMPTLVDNGFALWESRPILTYLVNKYGKDDSLYPKDAQKRATVDQRLYFDVGTLHERIRGYFMKFRAGAPTDAEGEKLHEALDFVDKFLEGREWIAGSNITVADYAIACTISYMEFLKFDISKHTNTTKWYAKAKAAIPTFSEVEEKGNDEFRKGLAAQAAARK